MDASVTPASRARASPRPARLAPLAGHGRARLLARPLLYHASLTGFRACFSQGLSL